MRRRGLVLGLLMACAASLQLRAYSEPITISTVEELQRIGNDPAYPLDGEYCLTQDIDASATANWNGGAGFEPIGDLGPFTGVFDGQGHAIRDAVISHPESRHVGLFSYVGDGGVVRNLGIEGGSVTGRTWVGGLAGRNSGTVSRCHATCAVTGEGGFCGGLVGHNNGAVSHCYATGAVTGKGDVVGGLVGMSFTGAVSQCYAAGTVTGGKLVGGLVGYNGGTVSQCYATGAVTGDELVSGLTGENAGAVSHCYATGVVTGDELVGGLAGVGTDSSVEGSFWDTETTGIDASPQEASGGTGLPTALLQTRRTFTDAGWDFDAVWGMVDGETYPYLLSLSARPG